MTDMSIPKAVSATENASKPAYERPSLKVLTQEEVLQAFQIAGTEISAAGCWWTPSC